MNQIDPKLLELLLQFGLLSNQQPPQPGLLTGVSGKPIQQPPSVPPVKKPIFTTGIRG